VELRSELLAKRYEDESNVRLTKRSPGKFDLGEVEANPMKFRFNFKISTHLLILAKELPFSKD
jgi:hypothetical protein